MRKEILTPCGSNCKSIARSASESSRLPQHHGSHDESCRLLKAIRLWWVSFFRSRNYRRPNGKVFFVAKVRKSPKERNLSDCVGINFIVGWEVQRREKKWGTFGWKSKYGAQRSCWLCIWYEKGSYKIDKLKHMPRSRRSLSVNAFHPWKSLQRGLAINRIFRFYVQFVLEKLS